jgi:hypothetical protein
MNGTDADPSLPAPEGRPRQSRLRTLLTIVVLCAIPLWLVATVVKDLMEIAAQEARGLYFMYSMPDDIGTGFVTLVLQCAALVVNRTSKGRKLLLFYLLAVPAPLLFGLVMTWQGYKQIDQGTANGVILPKGLVAHIQSESWNRTYFGLAASLFVLLIGVCGLAWKKPQHGVRCDPGVNAPPLTKPRRFQFSLATLMFIVTAVCVFLSGMSCFPMTMVSRGIVVASVFFVISSCSAVIYSGDYGCAFSVIFLCLWGIVLRIAGTYQSSPVGALCFFVSLLLISIVLLNKKLESCNYRSASQDGPK